MGKALRKKEQEQSQRGIESKTFEGELSSLFVLYMCIECQPRVRQELDDENTVMRETDLTFLEETYANYIRQPQEDQGETNISGCQ